MALSIGENNRIRIISEINRLGATSALSYGASGDGTTDDTAALTTALASGNSIDLPTGYRFKITSGLSITTNFQRFGGEGVLVPVGSFDAVTVGSAASGVELDLTVSAASQTGGCAININNANRTIVHKLYMPDGGYNAINVQKANFTEINWLYTPALAGSYCIRWYGDASNRSDILILKSGVCSFSTVGTARGIDWDGNCHSLTIFHFGIVGAPGGNRPLYGLHIRNTSGATAPAIGRLFDLEVDYPDSDCIRVDAGQDYDFVGGYYQGSAAGSGVRIASGLVADSIRIMGGKATGNNQYGVNTATSVIVSDLYTASNSVGNFTGYSHSLSPTLASQDDNSAYALIAGRYSSGFGGAALNTTTSCTFLDIQVAGITALRLSNTASGVNFLNAIPGATGNPAALAAMGGDTNIDLRLTAKGTGVLRLGTSGMMAANGSVATALSSVGPTGASTTVQEWLQVKNSAGATRYIPCF